VPACLLPVHCPFKETAQVKQGGDRFSNATRYYHTWQERNGDQGTLIRLGIGADRAVSSRIKPYQAGAGGNWGFSGRGTRMAEKSALVPIDGRPSSVLIKQSCRDFL
jgi:hypothetical protein